MNRGEKFRTVTAIEVSVLILGGLLSPLSMHKTMPLSLSRLSGLNTSATMARR
jgi:hypothetical protein